MPVGQNTRQSVNPSPQKYSHFTEIRNYGISRGSPARGRGRFASRSKRGPGCGGRGSVVYEMRGQGGLLSVSPRLRADERRCKRTAKPCGPGRRCYGQALTDAAVASTGAVPATFARVREARRNSAPGRARHKPSDHCAGEAECWASPVCCCAVSFALHAHSRPRVPLAPGLPCALFLLGDGMKQSSGEMSREAAKLCLQFKMRVGERCRCPLLRHCERSEAIQNLSAARLWIASLRSQ